MSEEIGTGEGLTRREALKKGARLGGALVWAVPVVQTIGMSPAMAQTVSEGNCCLRVDIVALEVIANDVDGVLNDVRVTFNGTNCGSAQIFDVLFTLERRKIAPAVGDWGPAAVAAGGNPLPGGTTGTQQVIVNLTDGDYEFRLSATKACVENGAPLPHDIPLPYAFAGPITIDT